MHLLEAALAWGEFYDDELWPRLADDVVHLCLMRFIDANTLTLREYFDKGWRLAADALGRSVEPGHQFEWAWLLGRWARLRGRKDAHEMACRLFRFGERGVDPIRGVTVDDAFNVRRNSARLWPQNERLKVALILADTDDEVDRNHYLQCATEVAESLWRYLDTPVKGLWYDKMLPNGTFFEEPAPASSLYHIICAVASLRQDVGGADSAPSE